MSTIIASRFQLKEQAESAVERLIQVGFATEKVSSFYVNPPGQHATYPIGGDRYKSPDKHDSDKSAASDSAGIAVVETIIGVDADKKNRLDAVAHQTSGRPDDSVPVDSVPIRKAGMLVAVELGTNNRLDQLVALLRALGAENIEKLDGEIIDGEWPDFDPLTEPAYL